MQGCTSRINHLETDLLHRMDSLQQQQDSQAVSAHDMTAHIARMQSQLKDMHGSSSSSTGQMEARLTELNAQVVELLAVNAGHSEQEADSQLKADVHSLTAQVCQLETSQASQRSAASSLVAIQHDVGVLQTELSQLQSSQAAQGSAESALSRLEQDIAGLSAGLSQMQNDHANQSSKGNHDVTQRIDAVQAELRQLHDTQSYSSAHELYSDLVNDVAILKTQLSKLDSIDGSQHAHDKWQEETQQLRSELAACVKAEKDTEAALAHHTSQLSSFEQRLTELHVDMESADAHAQSAAHCQVSFDLLTSFCLSLQYAVMC